MESFSRHTYLSFIVMASVFSFCNNSLLTSYSLLTSLHAISFWSFISFIYLFFLFFSFKYVLCSMYWLVNSIKSSMTKKKKNILPDTQNPWHFPSFRFPINELSSKKELVLQFVVSSSLVQVVFYVYFLLFVANLHFLVLYIKRISIFVFLPFLFLFFVFVFSFFRYFLFQFTIFFILFSFAVSSFSCIPFSFVSY